jgi:hypothetical protein
VGFAVADLADGHGLLGVLIITRQPLRLPDLSEDTYGAADTRFVVLSSERLREG